MKQSEVPERWNFRSEDLDIGFEYCFPYADGDTTLRYEGNSKWTDPDEPGSLYFGVGNGVPDGMPLKLKGLRAC